jgi:hypothetical protein
MRTDKVASGGSHAKREDWAYHLTVVKKIRGMLRNEALGLIGGGRDDLKHDCIRSKRNRALAYCLRMIFSENRCPLFRIMR